MTAAVIRRFSCFRLNINSSRLGRGISLETIMNPLVPNWVIPLTTAVCFAGCHCADYHCDQCGTAVPTPLGTISDPIWKTQESNAEASDFVIHEHEWVANTDSLNDAGINHLMRIMSRIHEVPFPVVLEPSSQSVRETTLHKFPIHNDLKLDTSRRDVIVDTLMKRGVTDAQNRVHVGPATAPGFESFEGERAYSRGFRGGDADGALGRGGIGFGGGFGGGGFY